MEKEVLKIKSGESVELDIWGKKIEIHAEETKDTEPSDHMKDAFSVFSKKMAEILPALKGEKGTDGKEWKSGTPGRDGRDGKDGINWQDGKDGKDGQPGENGKSAYEQAVENGFTGTLEDWLQSLKWKDGKDGKPGEAGRDGRPGDPGPRGVGVMGPSGASAYQIAVQNGYVGTEIQWLQENENLIIAYSISL